MLKVAGPEKEALIITKYFKDLTDPRRTNKGNLLHKLSDIIVLTISAVLCGADEWTSIHDFGQSQEKWLRTIGDFKNGIPSIQTLRRFFASLDPEGFNECFMNWMNDLSEKVDCDIIALDGKVCRGADPGQTGTKLAHIVSAFSFSSGICLAQQKVSEKSNEITAVPRLLKLLDLCGCIVTADAMACQKKIAACVIDGEGDYVLATKKNQSFLYDEIEKLIEKNEPESIWVSEDIGHGRIEKRTCCAYSVHEDMHIAHEWLGLKSVVSVNAIRIDKKTGKETEETRYYISSLLADAEKIGRAVRNHWSIENNLHWVLDVTFGEDKSRKRDANSAENFNMLLKIALALLVKDKSMKISKKNKRFRAALDTNYREKLLGIKQINTNQS